MLALLFTGIMIASIVTHRTVGATSLRRLAPDWESWRQGKRFPMGLALGPTLAAYLCLAALNGA
jgi:prepilin peptidase CpaA